MATWTCWSRPGWATRFRSGSTTATSISHSRCWARNADYAQSVSAADVDGDGDLDVLAASLADDKLAWYERNEDGSYTEHAVTAPHLGVIANGASSIAGVDLDGDGDTDLLAASLLDDTIAWYENDGDENFTQRIVTTTADGARDAVAVDVDGDGDLDLLAVSENDDTVAWYENDGDQNFTQHTIATDAGGVRAVVAADLNGDGAPDALVAARSGDEVLWYANRHAPGAPMAGPGPMRRATTRTRARWCT